MSFPAIMGFSLIVTALLIIIKRERPEFALGLTIAAGAMIFLTLLGDIGRIITVFQDLAVKSSINNEYLKMIFKIIGLAYVAGFGVQICKDAGEHTIAAKVELAGKIAILSMGLPLVVSLLNMVLQMI